MRVVDVVATRAIQQETSMDFTVVFFTVFWLIRLLVPTIMLWHGFSATEYGASHHYGSSGQYLGRTETPIGEREFAPSQILAAFWCVCFVGFTYWIGMTPLHWFYLNPRDVAPEPRLDLRRKHQYPSSESYSLGMVAVAAARRHAGVAGGSIPEPRRESAPEKSSLPFLATLPRRKRKLLPRHERTSQARSASDGTSDGVPALRSGLVSRRWRSGLVSRRCAPGWCPGAVLRAGVPALALRAGVPALRSGLVSRRCAPGWCPGAGSGLVSRRWRSGLVSRRCAPGWCPGAALRAGVPALALRAGVTIFGPK